jgi:hypothetical protein
MQGAEEEPVCIVLDDENDESEDGNAKLVFHLDDDLDDDKLDIYCTLCQHSLDHYAYKVGTQCHC